MNLPQLNINRHYLARLRLIIAILAIGLLSMVAISYAQDTQAVSGNFSALSPIVAGSNAGAHLPISYNLSSLAGSVLYVAPNGSSGAACSASAPCTLGSAVSKAGNNATIVLRGGIYRNEGNMTLGQSGLHVIAYPGEIPDLRGSNVVSGGWTADGNAKYISYVPRPVVNGGGVGFGDLANANKTSGCINLNGDCVGMYPDQAFIGDKALQQVSSKAQVTDGKFFVDRGNKRLYLSAADSGKSGIEVSHPGSGSTATTDRLFKITGANVTVEGLRIGRYSPNAGDYGVITIEDGGDNSLLLNVEISHAPYEGLHYNQGNVSSTVKNVTLSDIAWEGINTNKTDKFTLDSSRIINTDPFDVFTSSPVSGAIKTSRNRDTVISNSDFSNNKSHGVWFDQSNINSVVANNRITDTYGSALFYEISDGLLLINNYIKSSGGNLAVKIAGSTGIKMVNNTIVGGGAPLGVYTDARSIPGCSTRPSGQACQYDSEVQRYFPVPKTMDWMTRIDYSINNIFAYPTGSNYCGAATVACYTTKNGSASQPINKIIHKADDARGIPQTFMDGNVYASSDSLVRVSSPGTNYTSLSSFTSAMASSTGISGIEANSKSGSSWVNQDGTPTAALSAANSQAIAVPKDAAINKYIAAGVKQYGATNSNGTVPPTVAPTQPTVAPTTKPAVTTTKPPVTTTKPAVTTTKPSVVTTKPPVVSTVPPTVKPPVPPTVPPTVKPPVPPTVPPTTKPPISNTTALDKAARDMIQQYCLSKVKISSYDFNTGVAKGRIYFQYNGLLYLAADITATIHEDGTYNITSLNAIVSVNSIS